MEQFNPTCELSCLIILADYFVLFCFVLISATFSDSQGLLLPAICSKITLGLGDRIGCRGTNPGPSWISPMKGKCPIAALSLRRQKMLLLNFHEYVVISQIFVIHIDQKLKKNSRYVCKEDSSKV